MSKYRLWLQHEINDDVDTRLTEIEEWLHRNLHVYIGIRGEYLQKHPELVDSLTALEGKQGEGGGHVPFTPPETLRQATLAKLVESIAVIGSRHATNNPVAERACLDDYTAELQRRLDAQTKRQQVADRLLHAILTGKDKSESPDRVDQVNFLLDAADFIRDSDKAPEHAHLWVEMLEAAANALDAVDDSDESAAKGEAGNDN